MMKTKSNISFQGKDFDLIFSKLLYDSVFLIYSHEDFFGQPITLGVKVYYDLVNEEQSKCEITIKCALCSKEDTYDKELGVDIVLGRLFKSRTSDVKISYDKSDLSSINNFIKLFITNSLKEIKGYIDNRDDVYSSLDTRKQMFNKTLKSKFKKFK